MNDNKVEPIFNIYNEQNANASNQVVVQQPIRITILGREPMAMTCPHCKVSMTTKVELKPGDYAWMVCITLTFTGFFLGCQFIPFCLDCAKDANHYCPTCQKLVGSVSAYKPSGGRSVRFGNRHHHHHHHHYSHGRTHNRTFGRRR
ncbi:unnamed protein product [Brachionus calyciflorus]|uniref:LITAF domain-containing protein n=1 Tax=Brachionus calyciflorus TaxID=104777 RepID=A0A814L862_9BILA|nr:unnamed protein product [Brachionus calyciflorus]